MHTYFFFVLPTVLALENVALNKPAQQKSESLAFPGPARRAVDGNTDGNLYHSSCTHTNEYAPDITTWWKVDLMGFYKVSGVEIFGRTDCCRYRLQQFEVRVSLVNPTTFPSNEGQQCFNRTNEVPGSGLYINCSQPIIGRYVSLYKTNYDVLSICELRVFAERAGISKGGCFQNPAQASSPAVNFMTCAYSGVRKNFRVVGMANKSSEAVSATTCAMKCAQTGNCSVFNFLRSTAASNPRGMCEVLLGIIAFSEYNLIPQTGWLVFVLNLVF